MCIVNCSRRVKGPVVAWKLLEKNSHGTLVGIQDFKYKVGKLYTDKPSAPGFQAFVNRKDAEYSIRNAWFGYFVRKVFLYDAAQGIIINMDGASNGKPGWKAKKIRILRETR